MLTYVIRRMLYSIPVLLIASFLLFWGVRVDVRSDRGAPHVARAASPSVERRDQPRPRRPDHHAVRRLARRRRARRFRQQSADRRRGLAMMIRRVRQHAAAHRLGDPDLRSSPIALGVYSAVKQYSVGDYVFTGLSYVGIAMPPFWFGLIAIEFFAVGRSTSFDLDQPLFFFVGLHSGGQHRLNLDYVRHLVLPVLTLCVQIVAVVEPLPAGLHARRAVGRLRAHGAGEGRAAAQGDLQARAAQRADPARHRHGARHRRAVRWPHHHRADLLHPGHGPAVLQRPADAATSTC